MTNHGEEGATIASSAALEMTDTIYGQYREAGAIMWRGYTLRQCMDQCYGNRQDQGHGKQMPVHYGDNNLNFQTISSCLSTQMPQGKQEKHNTLPQLSSSNILKVVISM